MGVRRRYAEDPPKRKGGNPQFGTCSDRQKIEAPREKSTTSRGRNRRNYYFYLLKCSGFRSFLKLAVDDPLPTQYSRDLKTFQNSQP